MEVATKIDTEAVCWNYPRNVRMQNRQNRRHIKRDELLMNSSAGVGN